MDSWARRVSALLIAFHVSVAIGQDSPHIGKAHGDWGLEGDTPRGLQWSNPAAARTEVSERYIGNTKTFFKNPENLEDPEGYPSLSIHQCPDSPAKWKEWRDSVSDFLYTSVKSIGTKESKIFFDDIDRCLKDVPSNLKSKPNIEKCVGDFKTYFQTQHEDSLSRAFFENAATLKFTEVPKEFTKDNNELVRMLGSVRTYESAIARIEEANKARPPEKKWRYVRYQVQNIPGSFMGKFVTQFYIPEETPEGVQRELWVRVESAPRNVNSSQNLCIFSVVNHIDPENPFGFKKATYIGDFDLTGYSMERRRVSDSKKKSTNCKNCHFSGPLFINPDPSSTGPDPKAFWETIDFFTEKMENHGSTQLGRQLYAPGTGPRLGDEKFELTEEFLQTCSQTVGGVPLVLTPEEHSRHYNRLRTAMRCTHCHNDKPKERNSIRPIGSFPGGDSWFLINRLISGNARTRATTGSLQRVVMPPEDVISFSMSPQTEQEKIDQWVRSVLPACLNKQYQTQFGDPLKIPPADRRLNYLLESDCGTSAAATPTAPSSRGTLPPPKPKKDLKKSGQAH